VLSCGVHGKLNHLLKLCWWIVNCVEEVEKYVRCLFQLMLGAWLFHPVHCSSWYIWGLCTVHDILWGWVRCAGCCKMWRISAWKHLRYLSLCVCVCVCVCLCVCMYVNENLIHTTVLSEKEGVCYRLLYCHRQRQFVTGCCIVIDRDSLLQAAVLS
jgi:hypothetical protein